MAEIRWLTLHDLAEKINLPSINASENVGSAEQVVTEADTVANRLSARFPNLFKGLKDAYENSPRS